MAAGNHTLCAAVLQKAHKHVSASLTEVDFMLPTNLNCIASLQVSAFETQWLKVFNYVITADCMYWQDSTCFFTVCLTPPQWELFSIYHSAPHTSLSKQT